MKRTRTAHESSDLRITHKTLLSCAGGMVVFTAGATFTLTKLSTSSHAASLQTELDGTRDRLKQQDAELRDLKASTAQAASSFVAAASLPDATMIAAGDPNVENLAARILDLEKERATLLAELAERSRDALDPKSELANLLSQLSADSSDARMKAVRGLFDLADPRAFNSLVAYFNANRKEATNAKHAFEWTRLLLALDRKGGILFMIQQLQSDNHQHAEWAYEELGVELLSTELLHFAIAQLESVALRSADTVTRTRAKLLLHRFTGRLKNPGDQPDPRGLYSILRDIETEVKKLTKQLNSADEDKSINPDIAGPNAPP